MKATSTIVKTKAKINIKKLAEPISFDLGFILKKCFRSKAFIAEKVSAE
jgi:hypothetical protein